jgi:hypothetical protein
MRWLKMLTLCAALAALCACADAPSPPDEPGVEAKDLIVIGETVLGRSEISYLFGSAVDEYALYRDIEPDMIEWNGQTDGLPVRRYFLDRVLEMAITAHVTALKAAELGYALTEEEEDAIDWEIAMELDGQNGRNEEIYRFYSYTVPTLREKMLEDLFGGGGPYELDESVLWRYFQVNYISAAYIFLTGTNNYGEPMDEAEWTLQKSVAEALRRSALGAAGVDGFFELVRTHDQSYYMMLYPEGMPVPRGLFGDDFDAALSALEVGGISDVVVTDDGFYIILRLPEDLEWYESNKEYIWYYCAHEAFLEKTAEWGREMEITVSDAFWELDPLEVLAVG